MSASNINLHLNNIDNIDNIEFINSNGLSSSGNEKKPKLKKLHLFYLSSFFTRVSS